MIPIEGIVEKIGVFGVVLLALAVLIGVGFGVFSIAKNTANEGVVGVQDALGAMNESIYNDFDQKTLSGTQVLSAYNTMNGKPVGIIVKTCKGEWVNYTDRRVNRLKIITELFDFVLLLVLLGLMLPFLFGSIAPLVDIDSWGFAAQNDKTMKQYGGDILTHEELYADDTKHILLGAFCP